MKPLVKISEVRKTLLALARREIKILVSVFVIVSGTLLFIQIADEVNEGATKNFDEWILKSFREPGHNDKPIWPDWVTNSVRDITALGSGTVIILFTLFVLGFLLFQKEYTMVYLILGATLGGGLLGLWFKEIFGRERPEMIFHLMPEASLSFPSGHSMMSMVLYLSFAALLARIQKRTSIRIYIISIALFLSLIIGLSRIYLGVHYPTDVLGGWSVGIAWASFCWLIAFYLERRVNKKSKKEEDQLFNERGKTKVN